MASEHGILQPSPALEQELHEAGGEQWRGAQVEERLAAPEARQPPQLKQLQHHEGGRVVQPREREHGARCAREQVGSKPRAHVAACDAPSVKDQRFGGVIVAEAKVDADVGQAKQVGKQIKRRARHLQGQRLSRRTGAWGPVRKQSDWPVARWRG